MISKPTLALLAGASLWGVVWYPYRVLAQAGLDGVWATALTYGLALLAGCAFFPREIPAVVRMPALAWVMAAAIGWSNLAYVLAVLEGEVMRVLLLFYLAPLWTVPLARLLLDERLDGRGVLAMVLAVAGAAAMLWRPEVGFPWPASKAEWLGLSAGFFFALGNILVRKIVTMTDAGKSVAIWLGVMVVALAYLPFGGSGVAVAAAALAETWILVAVISLSLVAMGLSLQYGLARTPANRAIIILLVELPVAAVAAWLLTDETLRPQDALGGALIVAATLAKGK